MLNCVTLVGVLGVLQQSLPATPGNTTPPSGDTVGYWQQKVAYTIVATLDERAQKVRARGTLHYVNNSPDTLREMYVHQYLNAFRPGSDWSRIDEREGRERFQHLREPDFGYERFTAPVRVDGTAVKVDYPGAPDSTVAHFALPRPLAPHDSLDVAFEWDARPSTIPRRQGRRGRTWDLAQWYPKVAVYDRAGWQPNSLKPAGEFYGEFGTYDVTLLLAPDQIVGATGMPVPASAEVLAGYKAVRLYARDVHHFAWSASPDYRTEDGVYVRKVPPTHFRTWDTVAIHALYKPPDDTTWGQGKVVQRTINALGWLESIYGPYAYPQMTVLHRLDGGGTEFPMMQMNGSPSQGLILHEGGHVFTYGILGNNEWRSGWMDEGLTSYQTSWAQALTPQERVRLGIVDQLAPVHGYRAHAIRMLVPRGEQTAFEQALTDLLGGSQPIGTVAHEFRDFATYNDMIYDRAEVMYSQLRDALGDTLFLAFLHDYYGRWALKHVDERAMRASVERVSGRDFGWFFDQWVHHTGVLNYALRDVRSSRDSSGKWITTATAVRLGTYRHPVTLGVRTSSGWTLQRSPNDAASRQTLTVVTLEQPLEVRLDPLHFSWDWDRRDDTPPRFALSRVRFGFDWPFLSQADREHDLLLWSPLAWYSEPGGAVPGLRLRGSYLGFIDKVDFGAAITTRAGLTGPEDRLQWWARSENATMFGRPRIGLRTDVGYLDDILEADVGYAKTRAWGRQLRAYDVALTMTHARPRPLLPALWDTVATVDLSGKARWSKTFGAGSYLFAEPRFVAGTSSRDTYAKGELALGGVRTIGDAAQLAIRGYAGAPTHKMPAQRALYLGAADPVSTFYNHWWRPAGAILKQDGVDWLPLGGAALRGYRWELATNSLVGAVNVDASRMVMKSFGTSTLALWGHAFADGAAADNLDVGDAGVGLSVRGRLYDKPIMVRIDSPFFMSDPRFAVDRGRAGTDKLAPRWAITFSDWW